MRERDTALYRSGQGLGISHVGRKFDGGRTRAIDAHSVEAGIFVLVALESSSTKSKRQRQPTVVDSLCPPAFYFICVLPVLACYVFLGAELDEDALDYACALLCRPGTTHVHVRSAHVLLARHTFCCPLVPFPLSSGGIDVKRSLPLNSGGSSWSAVLLFYFSTFPLSSATLSLPRA